MRICLFVLIGALSLSSPARAQSPALEGWPLFDANALVAKPSIAAELPVVEYRVEVTASRPRLLIPMYASLAALNGLDVYFTHRALDAGHVELNPLFRTEKHGGLIAAKVASTVVAVWCTERLWKVNRKAAIGLMIASNVGLALIVANNASLAY